MSMSARFPSMRSLTRHLSRKSDAEDTHAAPSAPPPDPAPTPVAVAPLRPGVDIPVCDPSPDAKAVAALIDRGRFLARQDAWEDLCREIGEADVTRRLTPGLTSAAQLLAKGARSDVNKAAASAAAKGEPRMAQAIMATLESNLQELPDCPALNYVVATAHVDIANVWRGASQVRELSPQRRQAHDNHMARAAQLIERFDPFEIDSAMWAAVRCTLLPAAVTPSNRLADDYEDLIDMIPDSPDPMTDFGRDLLPQRFGSYGMLDLQARRTAARTSDIWGMGAYTWVYMGALEYDLGAFQRIDSELFMEGLHHILERCNDQHTANRFAAFAGFTLSGAFEANSPHARLAHAFCSVMSDHLREIHPLVWAKARKPGLQPSPEIEESDLVRRGKSRAISAIAEAHAQKIARGQRVVVSDAGVEVR